MLNNALIYITDCAGYLLKSVKLDKRIRPLSDIRLVFYHGIGDKVSSCMKYLDDEIPLNVFEEHINYLQDKYTLLSLSDIVARVRSRDLPTDKPICNVSFDDGLSSVYSNAFPIMKKKGLPFDVFINTLSTGNNELLWLHALNYLLTKYGSGKIAGSINELIDTDFPQVLPQAPSIERWCRANFEYFLGANIIKDLFEVYGLKIEDISVEEGLYLNWDHVEEMSSCGVGFYSHTHSHYPLNALSREELIKNEIQISYDIIEAHNQKNQFISFPFGMEVDYGKVAIKHALATGHEFIVEVGNGLNSINRINSDRMLSRVSLGNVSTSCASLYAAIEIRPVVKTKLKKILGKA